MATYLTRTTADATSNMTATFSWWFKRSNIVNNDGQGGNYMWVLAGPGSFNDANWLGCELKSDDTLRVTTWSGGTELQTTRVFRDVGAWYHIVVRIDTSQSTEAERVRIYINGTEETSFATSNYPPHTHDYNCLGDVGAKHFIGCAVSGTTASPTPYDYFNGYIADFIQSSGQSYAPTSFGETDSTTGIWKPKTFSGSFGDNGFHLQFKNSGALGTDTSGEGHTLTVSGAGTNAQVVDTPTNNFATLNSIANATQAGGTFSEGNLKFVTNQADYSYRPSSIGVNAGKWYCEIKAVSFGGGSDPYMIGITSTEPTANSDELGHYANDWAYREDGKYRNNNSNTTWGNTFTSGDIIGIALDLTNSKLYFSKNGTWQESGDPTSGSTGTGAISITAVGSTPLENYFFAIGDYDNSSGSTSTFQANFGNPPFTISSGNADANGFGNFEYAVPSGYYALCTENLNTYG